MREKSKFLDEFGDPTELLVTIIDPHEVRGFTPRVVVYS